MASLPASNIQIQNVGGTVTVKDSQHISYRRTFQQLLKKRQKIVPNHRNYRTKPTEFIVDDFDGIQDPNDMVGMRLEMKAVASPQLLAMMGNLRLAIAKAGLQLRDFVLTPLAYSKTILDDGQQEFGTIILDMGAGHTTATVVHDHQLKFLSTFPAGSDNISRDISAVLEVGLHDADMLKLDSGLALSSMAREDNKLVIKKISSENAEQISEVLLAQIIAARSMQILDKLGEKLQLVGAFDLPGGIVVVGGGAALRGMIEAIRSVYNVQVKSFSPTDIGLRHPGFSGAWALVHYAAQQSPIQLIVKEALYGLPLTVVGQPTIAVATPVQKPATNRRPARPESQAVVEPSVNDTDDVNYDDEDKPKKKGAFLNFFKEFFD